MSSYAHEGIAPVTQEVLNPFAYGRGFLDIEYPANPAAGVNFSETVDGRYISRLVSATWLLTTSAVVANRTVTLDTQDGNGKLLNSRGAAVNVLAGSTQIFSADIHRSGDAWISGGTVFFGLDEYYLEPGRKIIISVLNIDVGDQLSKIVFSWERFPTGPRGYPEGRVGPDSRRAAQHHRPSHHPVRP